VSDRAVHAEPPVDPLAGARAAWQAGRLLEAATAAPALFDGAVHAMAEQARSLLPNPPEGWAEEPLVPTDPLSATSVEGLRRGVFAVARALRRGTDPGRVVVAFLRHDPLEDEVERDLLDQARTAGTVVEVKGRAAYAEEGVGGRRTLRIRLAAPRGWVAVVADAGVPAGSEQAVVDRLRLDEMESMVAEDPSPPVPPYDPAVLFEKVDEARRAGRSGWVLHRTHALAYGLYLALWRRVTGAFPKPPEGWTDEEPPLAEGELYPPTVLPRRYERRAPGASREEAEVWVIVNRRPEMIEGHREGLKNLGPTGPDRVVDYQGRKALRITQAGSDTESLAVLLGDGTFVLVVSVRPREKQDLAEPFTSALDLEAIERAVASTS
jgi:hypothetical protein